MRHLSIHLGSSAASRLLLALSFAIFGLLAMPRPAFAQEKAGAAAATACVPSDLNALIFPEGRTVRVNEVIGVAGFVVPGTRVDVMVILREGQSSIARVVVSNVQVLTAGTRFDQENAKNGKPIPSTVVTLLVTPEDSERIALASMSEAYDLIGSIPERIRQLNIAPYAVRDQSTAVQLLPPPDDAALHEPGPDQ